MIIRFAESGWQGIERETYKDEPGTWVGVTRDTLFRSPASLFETRYFEIAAGGYTTYERHVHEHCVIVHNGFGEVRLGTEWQPVQAGDVVIVPTGTPHQFRASVDSPIGIFCIVDRDRDRPQPLAEQPADSDVE